MIKDFCFFIKEISVFFGLKGLLAISLSLAVSLTQGIGLLMIIPMLEFSGITKNSLLHSQKYFITDFMIKTGIKPGLMSVLIFYIFIFSVFSTLKYFNSKTNSTLQQIYIADLRKKLYRSFTYSDWLYITTRKKSDLIQLLTNEIRKTGTGIFFLFSFITSIITVLVHLGVAFILSFPLTLLTITSSLIIILIMAPMNKKTHNAGKKRVELNKMLYGASVEHLYGIKTAKIFNSEETHLKKFLEINNEIKDKNLKHIIINARTRIFYEISSVFLISIYLYSAVALLRTPILELLLLVLIFARIIPKVTSINHNFQNIVNMLPSFIQIKTNIKFFSSANNSKDKKNYKKEFHQELELDNISFKYDEKSVLKNICLKIKKGEIIAIKGNSGAGKSTLADLVAGLIQPCTGSFYLDGKKTSNLHHLSTGYVLQSPFLFNDTIKNNLLWARQDADESQIEKALLKAAALDFIQKLPKGLNTKIGDFGIKLSGGEKQRIALAMVLLKNYPVIVLDEPTSAIDNNNQKRIFQTMEELKKDKAILLISHKNSVLKNADKIFLLESGLLKRIKS